MRPHATDKRGRSLHEHMVHQCVSEDIWFRTILGVSMWERRRCRKQRSGWNSCASTRKTAESAWPRWGTRMRGWWEGETSFSTCLVAGTGYDRRIAHTAHHRGQQLCLLRMLGRDEYSNYGPTADTGGLMLNHAPTIYAYPNLQALFEGEAAGGRKTQLPGPGIKPVTERPG